MEPQQQQQSSSANMSNTVTGSAASTVKDSLECLTTSVAPSLLDTSSTIQSSSSSSTATAATSHAGYNPFGPISQINNQEHLWSMIQNLLLEDPTSFSQLPSFSQSPPPVQQQPTAVSSGMNYPTFSSSASSILAPSTISSSLASSSMSRSLAMAPSTTSSLLPSQLVNVSPHTISSAFSPRLMSSPTLETNVPSSQASHPSSNQVVHAGQSTLHQSIPYPPSSLQVGSGRIMPPATPSAHDLLHFSQSPPEHSASTSTGSGDASNTSVSSLSGGSCAPLLPIGIGGGTGLSPTSVEERFRCTCQRLESDVNSTIDLLVHGLQMRRNQLLQSLEHIKNIYTNAIYSSATRISTGQSPMSPPLPNGFGSRYPGSQENGQTISLLKIPNISFTKPDAALLKAVTTLGFFNLPAFAANCTASGEGLDRVTAGRSGIFTLATRNCFNEEILVGGMDEVIVEVFSYSHSSGQRHKLSSVSVIDNNNGKYTCEYHVPPNMLPGDEIRVIVRVNGPNIPNSPFVIPVGDAKPASAWKKILSFGDEGPQMGQFCRPWGVALSKMPLDLCITSVPSNEYMIAVADRSNNRIQLFRLDLSSRRESLMRVFGSGPGARAGQLDRPAGISLNPNIGHVVVADKDNHRIQVFDMFGKFLFKFGEKGNRPGQFNYPWDIDCNLNTNELVVSDTRNRRIQVFSAYGHFICQYTHHIDSPRGVAWVQPGDRIVITDFNKHRMVVFDRKPHQNPAHAMYGHGQAGPSGILTHMQMPPLCASPAGSPPASVSSGGQGHGGGVKYIGFGEGSGWGELLRPQGVAAADGRIICSDSRNNRVAIWSQAAQTFEYVLDGTADILDARANANGARGGSLLGGPSLLGHGAILGSQQANQSSQNNNNNNNSGINSTGVLDRPAGIAACDNLFVIVDFGHNRIHICIRQPAQQ